MTKPLLGRLEDERFVRGRGRYIADLHGRGALHGIVVRSPHAYARIVSIDTGAARAMPGVAAAFTGADLANVLNEAALLTARSNAQLIDDRALDEAIDRVIAGPQKRTRIMSAKERKITAYHEGGHALVAAAMNHLDP
ncbi:MAG: hypothetical protein DI543_27535, partial [Bradyrhizobium icense]